MPPAILRRTECILAVELYLLPASYRMEHVRINVRRLLILLLGSLVLPLAGIVALDLLVGSMPWLTIGGSLIFIPLSTVLITRATLAELDMVIEKLAPIEPDQEVKMT